MNELWAPSAADRAGHEFFEELDAVLGGQLGDRPASLALPTTAIVCQVIGVDGAPIWTDKRFEDWVGEDAVDPGMCARVRTGRQVVVIPAQDSEGDTQMLIYAPIAEARAWLPLRPEIMTAPPGSVAVAALCLSHLSDDLIRICRAMGMSNLEAKVCAALVNDGSVRRAAARCGVTYQTARKAFSEAMRRAGVSRQSQLVRRLYEVFTVARPHNDLIEPLLVQTFGLSRRDAQLALLLAEGHERAEAGAIAGLSSSATKDACSRIFVAMGIAKVPEAPRVVLDTLAAALLAGTEAPVINDPRPAREPLRLIQRDDNSIVAYSDHGPPDGRPVLIVHSSLSTRHPYRKVVRALQARGFRPLTLDRPGFGLTDDAPMRGGDPFAVGVEDVERMCAHAGIGRLDLLTRGCSFGALAIARAKPDLVGRVVVINPELLQPDCTTRKGNLGLMRKAFERAPEQIDAIARWMSARLARTGARRLLRLALKDSRIDIAAFEDPEIAEDYERGVMGFATGRTTGFVREQSGYALGFEVPPLGCAENWTIIIGSEDPVHDVAEIEAFWSKRLPGARFLRPGDAERYIELTHTELVVDALAGIEAVSGQPAA